jgi:nucleoside-diphosphate-sugar epimerase
MKVLIYGGYDFIGLNLMERLNKEGDEVYIIDNTTSGKIKSINEKHKFYNLDMTDKKCEEIYKDNKFEVVIYLASAYKTGLIGLNKALEYSTKTNVEKFVYLSTTEIYDKNENIPMDESSEISIESIFEADIFTAEQYCKIYNQKSDMQVFCLRVPNVYGPGQDPDIASNIIASKLQKVEVIEYNLVCEIENDIKNEEYIYVGDLIDGIYKTIRSGKSFIVNISSDKIYSNKKAKEELGWEAKSGLSKGLKKTLLWNKENGKTESKGENKESKYVQKYLNGNKKPYVENVALFVLLYLIDIFLKRNSIDISIDLTMLYIILIATIYGTKQAFISAILGIVLSGITRYQNGESINGIIYGTDTFMTIFAYVFIGISLGYVIDCRNDSIKKLKDKITEENDKFSFLHARYEEVRETKKQLEEQIISKKDNLAKLYKITERLDLVNSEVIFDEAINIICEIMKNEEVCIYILPKDQKYLRLTSKSKNLDDKIKKSINIEDYTGIADSIRKKDLFINKRMDKNIPTIMAPIIVDNEVIALIGVANMNFDSLVLYKRNLFKTISFLITGALSRAYKYEKTKVNEKYVENTEIIKTEYFKKIIEEKFNNRSSNQQLILKANREDYNRLITCIRVVDFIGINERNEMFILLTNTESEDGNIVIDRLERNKINTSIVDKNAIFTSNHVSGDPLKEVAN